jgi:iron complex outermembrane recepter protein
MKMTKKHAHLVARLLAASCLYGATFSVAQAQTAPQAAPQADQSTDSSNDIVITAQRRSERLVDVPITVSAVSGETLQNAGVTASNALNQVVPAFRLDYNGAFAQPTIRGVSTAIANVAGGSAVGVYIDGFYNASPLTQDFEFLNVSNVQVLKGPQGTLFGRNTPAGAVVVTTSEPSQTTHIQAKLDLSSFNTMQAAVYATTGLAKGLSFDIGGLYKETDGWMTNLTDGNPNVGHGYNFSMRTSLKYEFDESGKNYIMARYIHSELKDPTPMLWSVYQDPDGRFETAAYAFGIPGAVWGEDNRHMAADPGFNPLFKSKVDAGQLTAKFDVGFADLTSYSQYRNEKSRQELEVDDSSVPLFSVAFNNFDRLITQEFLLNSKSGGSLNWVVGAFYMDQKASEEPFGAIYPPGLETAYDIHQRIKSLSGFGDITWQAMDRLFLTFGARYSSEKDSGYYVCYPIGAAAGFCPGVTDHGGPPDATFNKFTPRGVIRYEITPQSSVYGSITKGYKAGLLDVNGFKSEGTIEPENITAYELGYKLSKGGTRLEASGFYYNYDNLQVAVYTGTSSITTNAAQSEVYGGELSLHQVLTDYLTFTGGVAYTHGRYKSYPGAPGNKFDYTTGTADNSPIDASGNRMIRSPDWTGNVALDGNFDVGGGKLNLNGNLYYSSKFYFDAANRNEQGSFVVANLRGSWTEPSGHVTTSIYCNNVSDTAYKAQVLPNGIGTGVAWNPPRIFGVSVGYQY